MRIGILTLTLHTNYGGILQAYALQTVLERMGHEVEVFNRPFTPQKTKWMDIPKRLIKKLLGRDVIILRERRYNREAPILNKAVWDFRKRYIHERIINSLHDIKEHDYDCIVVGSDQVWRPKYFKEQWHTGIEDAFLAFTKGWNIKRIAYAASFGVDTWEYSDEETSLCREAISMFDAISVREDSGITLLKINLGVDAIKVLDPTMLLNKNDYIALFEKDNTPQSAGNLLVYMLDANKEKLDLITITAKERELIPFTVNRTMVKQKLPIDERILPSVETWIRGFYDADYVVTDSFHACVFSLIFGKSFIVIGNERRGFSRFSSLFQHLNVSRKSFTINNNSITDCSINDDSKVKMLDYSKSSIHFLFFSIMRP